MWQHRFEKMTELQPEQIWPVIADIAGWAAVDHNIAWLEVEGTPAVGTHFRLRPKGGPALRFEVVHFDPPRLYADLCRMPGAAMTTRHRLHPSVEPSGGTHIVVEIDVTGPLAWFWGPIAAAKHAAGLPRQTDQILARAREMASASPSLKSAA